VTCQSYNLSLLCSSVTTRCFWVTVYNKYILYTGCDTVYNGECDSVLTIICSDVSQVPPPTHSDMQYIRESFPQITDMYVESVINRLAKTVERLVERTDPHYRDKQPKPRSSGWLKDRLRCAKICG